jgi:hypothetical protein
MKKVTALVITMVLIAFYAFAGVAGSIDAEVQKKMDMIKNSKSTGPFVDEIKFKKAAPQESPVAEATPTGYMGSLSALNIMGGIFEGGIVGAGCGLIGYSQTKNRDNHPLINGAVAGTISGASLAVILSLVELSSKRLSSSDDFGFDIIGGTFAGAALGAAGGTISYGKTTHTENISEGIGYGIAAGSAAGLIIGFIEFLLPESVRGGPTVTGGTHAYIRQLDANTTVISCNINY